MSSLRHSVSALLFLVLLGTSATAFAAPPGRQSQPEPRRDQQQDRPPHTDDALSDSVRRVERSTRGQVLSAERVPYDGRSVNRIKIVDDRGRVRVYMDDPQPRPPSQRPEPPTRGDDD
jgi:hypothetical protein